MAVNFPASPTNNQTFTSGGITWSYSTSIGAWRIVPNTIQGTSGVQGFQGIQGTTGLQGFQGTTGTQGFQGTTGFQGVQGIQGTTGTQGFQGITGTGLQGFQGIQGTSIQGASGAGGGVTTFSAGSTGFTPSTATAGAVSLAGTLAIASGGTNGSATPTAGGAAYGTGSAYAFTAAGTSGQALISNAGSAPTFQTLTLESLPGAWTKKSVRAATTGSITRSGTQTIDGIAVVVGDRVLVKNQGTASQNGIYLVASGTWTRSLDADTSDEIAGGTVNVDQGTTNAGTLWTTSFSPTNTIDSTAMNWYRIVDSNQIGVTVQAWDTNLDQIAALSPTSDNFIVGNGSSWTLETPTNARTSLGLGTIATQASDSVSITGGTVTGTRITPRVSTTASSATPSINTDNVDVYGITALTVNITGFTMSGTPTNGQKLWIYIVGTAARSITWGASFEASTIALPTTTVSTNRLDVGFVWNSVSSKWRCVGSA